jgi:rhamnose utilization protein RhaD (predicted bifunctional aldolase and dehydrogenase)
MGTSRPYPSRWDERHAAALTPLERLCYRSNLLGADRRLANWGGGNTSTKLDELDHLGRPLRVLRVKGSGTDLATIGPDGFAALGLDDLEALRERPGLEDAAMVDHLLRAGLDPGQPRPSIETLLHAFIPAPCVDHTHPDAIIALTCTPRGRELAADAFGDEFVWIDWIRPGFALAKLVADQLQAAPRARFVLLAKHGLVTWGERDRDCYETSLEAAERAARVLEPGAAGEPLGPLVRAPLAVDRRRRALAELLPVVRGGLSRVRHQVLEVDQGDRVLAFVGAAATPEVSQVGAACPDHLIHTKPRPLVLDATGPRRVRAALAAYERWYEDYFAAHQNEETSAFSIDPPGPRVVLAPGLGMVTAGADAASARIANELYHRAIEVIRLAHGNGGFQSLSVTGAASGIGRASAELLAAEGAHVAVADLNAGGAAEVADMLVERHGRRRALALPLDVTHPGAVCDGLERTVLEWGGVDIVVCCAGAALGAPIEATTGELWERNFDLLARGYFLVAQAAVEVLRRQAIGGSIVFVGSKNALVAGKENAAYSAAKAAELHLARCIAEEVGGDGIRVNCVNPDAVIAGSGIWSSEWRQARAAAYGIDESELEAHYRARTTLNVNVYPRDVAEAVLFFASERSAKTTGNMLNVDGGVAAAFPR